MLQGCCRVPRRPAPAAGHRAAGVGAGRASWHVPCQRPRSVLVYLLQRPSGKRLVIGTCALCALANVSMSFSLSLAHCVSLNTYAPNCTSPTGLVWARKRRCHRTCTSQTSSSSRRGGSRRQQTWLMGGAAACPRLYATRLPTSSAEAASPRGSAACSGQMHVTQSCLCTVSLTSREWHVTSVGSVGLTLQDHLVHRYHCRMCSAACACAAALRVFHARCVLARQVAGAGEAMGQGVRHACGRLCAPNDAKPGPRRLHCA